ncbi:hypothetical protein LCGC14_0617640 [marine sediment metagenome]|uniref:Uncharacterized protein n=1 Tax=marine sediment metagenome TaxID=412755 RepID=A0A0F9RQ25_9ZZZZ
MRNIVPYDVNTMTTEKKERVDFRLDISDMLIYRNFKEKHNINYTKLTCYLLRVAKLNEIEIASILKENKREQDLILDLPERIDGDLENVINVTQRGDIIIASTDKVEKGLVKKGYSESEITKISRYKKGDIFARDFHEYGLKVPKFSIITINGIVREGETSLLRNREFSEPLRLVIQNLWDTRGIETVLITNTERYRLNSILDYTKMEFQAIQTTFKGRMAQATNRTTGLTEVLRNYLITTALPPISAVELTVATLKANGVWVKETKELETYIDHFVDNILIGEYGYKMIAGFTMIALKGILLTAFLNIDMDIDEKKYCKKGDCTNTTSKNEKLCPTCKRKAEHQYLNTP